ncbi:hyphally regulated cell wall protein 3-like isoform X2 [Anopheles stephensi]|uniref:hyphally regulated cell wall protein 3-like isoform X2 n=1 Tax=Anopheles stephensi TaxID=30069 RepID=UPI001658BFA0|nr:hyphally regulated cell wall protein 3-like isoform X2 [Anopheles stephensi]
MDAVPVGEEQQPEEKETYSQPDVESSAAAVETVASTGCTDSRKDATDVTNASGGKDKEQESAVSRGSETAAAVKPTQSTDEEADQLDEPVIELDSSPEKMPALSKTKEESLKSPELEVFSIDDEEEQNEEEEHEEEEAVDEEDDYEDMDEDYEVYVEEKESANPHNSMDDDGSKLDLSTDEYTDEDVEAEQSPEKMGAKSASTPRRKSPSDPEQEDDEEEEDEDDDDDDDDDEENDEQEQEDDEDDDDVQIISYDEVIEEDGEDSEENEDNDEDSVRDESEEEHGKRKVHSGAKAKSGSGGHRRGFARFPITHVKYRSLKQKQVASIRKRTIRILNRHSMHVMDHNDDAQALSSDCKVIKTPRTTDPNSVFAPAKSPGQATILRQEIYGSASITSSDSQNDETKDTGITTAGGDKQHPVGSPKLTEGAAEKSSNTISSTPASSNPDDKMPTATAVEVSERIADSSDDAVSVLSSSTSTKKSVTAITPTVNSSASTEAVEQKTSASEQTGTTDASSKVSDADREVPSAKESSTATSLQDELSKQESNSTTSQKGEANVPSEKKQTNPSPAGLAEPTADDVMAGIDDFMDHNGSEDDAEDKQQEFNDDLTFQMDVDPPVGDRTKKEERAIDLTAVSEQSASKPQKPKESASSETPLADSEKEPRASSTSVAVSSAKEGNLDLHEKTVVTSTPVTNQKKGQQTRSDREQEAAPSLPSLEVKQEHEEEPDVNEAQNLSKQKSSGPRDTQKEVQPEKAPQQPTVSRKRRRSVTTEEDRQSSSGRADQDAEESIEPAKKLKLEVEANYQLHDCVVSEYIETTQNTSVSEIQSHTDALVKEIQELNDMIRETETKWNNLLHLKKVKEEILLRLNRRKHVIGIMDTQLGEVSVYSHLDSSNLSSQHHHQQSGRSSSVGPRPPTPPPEVEIRPASVTNSMHYGFNASNSGGAGTTTASNGGDKASSSHFGNSLISNRRSSSNSVQPASANSSSKASRNKDTNSFVSQFNSSNNAVTMVPLPNTTSMILNARASMNTVEVAKEKSAAVQIQRQILSKPILSNHQQILNNLAMSAGLTGQSGTSSSTNSGSNNGSSNSALLNGHHGSGTLTANQQHQLQIGRQGMRKDVSSIIADYRQKHPENVPRRGRRLKNVGGAGGGGSSSNSANNNGTSGGNGIGTFGEGGAISLTALSSGGKSPANVRPNSTDSVANRISELLAAAEQSPQQQHHQNQHHTVGSLHQQQQQSSLLSKASLPEVTLHPVMNSTAHSDALGGGGSHGNGSFSGGNMSGANSSTNSLLHGILTKSASRPGGQAAAAAAAAAAAVGNFNSFSPTLARLLTVPERMNTQSSSTVTSGALANLQTNSIAGGLNLSKNINEISITPVVGSNYQQTFLAQQQQQQTLQRLREQQLYNLDDEADDSADRLVIDEGDDMGGQRDSNVLHGGKRRGAEINENEVPQCQGCKKQEAKFVCAGCGNQWYCSRACQVNAWDDHSEVCSG